MIKETQGTLQVNKMETQGTLLLFELELLHKLQEGSFELEPSLGLNIKSFLYM